MNKNLAEHGFTLLELLFAIAMVGILAALALPAFDGSISRARVTSNANQLVGAINLARAEAVDRGEVVAVRPTTSGDWTDGWQVVTNLGGTEEQIRVFQPSTDNLTITDSPADFAAVFFSPSGFRVTSETDAAVPLSANILISDSSSGTAEQRRVCLSISGSVTVIQGGGTCP